MKIFVYGATGNVSAPLTDKLLAAGHTVVAGTRHPEKMAPRPGLVPVKVESQKPQEGVAALNGADAAFLIGPPLVADSFSAIAPFIEQAKKLGLKKVVLMTAWGVEFAPPEVPLRKLELLLESSGLSYNILRPNWFMQNFHSFWIGGILSDQAIYFPGGSARASFVDARDISAVAYELLVSDKFANRAFMVSGPESLNHDDAAARISAATGKTIVYRDVTAEAFKDSLLKAGLPADYVGILGNIAQTLKDGHAAAVSDDVKLVTGKDPISFAQYAQDYRSRWL